MIKMKRSGRINPPEEGIDEKRLVMVCRDLLLDNRPLLSRRELEYQLNELTRRTHVIDELVIAFALGCNDRYA